MSTASPIGSSAVILACIYCLSATASPLAGQTPTRNSCLIDETMLPFEEVGYTFLKALIKPHGLVSSLESDCFTTIYKNSLAAFAFIHQADIDDASAIFAFFQDRLTVPYCEMFQDYPCDYCEIPQTSFSGLPQYWDACTGAPILPPDTTKCPLWEGDNAFLLLALNYYAEVTGSYTPFEPLRDALRDWLSARSDVCGAIEEEGVADMFASLMPLGDYSTLFKLLKCYNGGEFDLDLTVRDALVFGDLTGFGNLESFSRWENWECNEMAIHAYSANSGHDFINVEISAQLLLAWRIWRDQLTVDLSPLRDELEKLRLLCEQALACSGVPLFVRGGHFPGDFDLPIVDSTSYLLFDSWALNPFAPGHRSAVLFMDGFESGDVSRWSTAENAKCMQNEAGRDGTGR